MPRGLHLATNATLLVIASLPLSTSNPSRAHVDITMGDLIRKGMMNSLPVASSTGQQAAPRGKIKECNCTLPGHASPMQVLQEQYAQYG